MRYWVARQQINARSNDYTDEILKRLTERLQKEGKVDKSKVVREAIEFYGIHVLGQEEVMNIKLYQHFKGD